MVSPQRVSDRSIAEFAGPLATRGSTACDRRELRAVRLPRGIPAASLKPCTHVCEEQPAGRLPRGIPAASLKHIHWPTYYSLNKSSAGNTRGLIEAAGSRAGVAWPGGLPRGIPAASLKRHGRARRGGRRGCLPRGIPAASLKRGLAEHLPRLQGCLPRGIPAASLKRIRFRLYSKPTSKSSAGNTRGLIEAASPPPRRRARMGLPRGIPAASLKPEYPSIGSARCRRVFRGEYPRPH